VLGDLAHVKGSFGDVSVSHLTSQVLPGLT
jgi:hypothetical protein